MYKVEVPLGVEPSVVYLIAAPGVEVVIVTTTEPAYIPELGAIVGVATCPVKTALPILLVTTPPLKADAFNVTELVRVIAETQTVDAGVGSVPSIVYLIVAPDVFVFNVTRVEVINAVSFEVIVGVSA